MTATNFALPTKCTPVYSKFAGRNLHFLPLFKRKLWKLGASISEGRTFTFLPRGDVSHVFVEIIKKYLV